MTFTEIVKAIGGGLFIIFIVSGIWLFCTVVSDFMMERLPGENKEEK